MTRLSLITVCGLEEISGHQARDVTHVLSILDPGWPDPDFGAYPPHGRTVLRFHDVIEAAPGLVPPDAAHMAAILGFGREIEVAEAGPEPHVLVHCHLGISRSTAAMIAILAQHSPDEDEARIV